MNNNSMTIQTYLSGILSMIFIAFLNPGYTQTIIDYDIEINTTLTLAGSPYLVTGYAREVKPGVLLTIQPGVVIKFESPLTSLEVSGSIQAIGTPEQPIYFTSYKDDQHRGDTNLDGNATSPAPRDWSSIDLAIGSTTSVFQYVWMGYGGGQTYDVNLYLRTGGHTIDHCTFTNTEDGIRFSDVSGDLTITNNTFENIPEHAISGTIEDYSGDIYLDNNNSTGANINGMILSGNISGLSTIHAHGNFPIVVDYPQDLYVDQNAMLTITPGSVFKFSSTRLSVSGTLKAIGTLQDSIFFTSINDDRLAGDTNGNGAATLPQPDDWEFLEFYGVSKNNELRNVWVGYGGQTTANANLLTYTADIIIDSCAFAHSPGRGIFYANNLTKGNIKLTNNTFTNTTSYAAYISFSQFSDSLTLYNNTSTGATHNGFVVRGETSGDAVFDTRGSFPLIILSYGLEVPENSKLTLVPGSIVKLDALGDINVYGSLQAAGTADRPIVITSLKDDSVGGDSNGDGNASVPQIAEWDDITFRGNSKDNLLRYTDILYGGNGIGSIKAYTSKLRLENCQVTNAEVGMYIQGVGISPEVWGTTFQNNTTAIEAYRGGANIQCSNFINNTSFGINNRSFNDDVVVARSCYWGHPSGPNEPNTNPSGQGDVIVGLVDYQPFSTVLNSSVTTYGDLPTCPEAPSFSCPEFNGIEQILSAVESAACDVGIRDNSYHYYTTETTLCTDCDINDIWQLLLTDLSYTTPVQSDFHDGSEEDNLVIWQVLAPPPTNNIETCNIIDLPNNVLDLYLGKIEDIWAPFYLKTLFSQPLTYRNPVAVAVDPTSFCITNYTLPGHILYPGKVTRCLVEVCGSIKMLTVGEGLHFSGGTFIAPWIGSFNQSEGKKLFQKIDQRFKQVIEDQNKLENNVQSIIPSTSIPIGIENQSWRIQSFTVQYQDGSTTTIYERNSEIEDLMNIAPIRMNFACDGTYTGTDVLGAQQSGQWASDGLGTLKIDQRTATIINQQAQAFVIQGTTSVQVDSLTETAVYTIAFETDAPPAVPCFCANNGGNYETQQLNNNNTEGDAILSGGYQSNGLLEATGIVEADSTVILRAGDQIRLLPGFEVLAGGILSASIQSCTILPEARNQQDEEHIQLLANEVIVDRGREEVLLYPNPSNGIVSIQLPGFTPLQVRIFDRTGRMIRQTMVSNEEEIDISTFPADVYFFQVVLPDQVVTRKLIRQ